MKTKLSQLVAIAAAFLATALNGIAANATTSTLTTTPTTATSRFTGEFVTEVTTSKVDDNALLLSDTTNLKGDLTIADESGLYANVVQFTGLKGRGSDGDYAKETRYFLGVEKELGSLNVDAGIGFYDLIGKTDDLKTYYIEIARPFTGGGTWKPSIMHEAYLTRSDAGYPDGHRTFFALSYGVDVRAVSVELKASMMRETGFGSLSTWTREISAVATYKVNDTLSLHAGIRSLVPSHTGDGQDKRLVGSFGAKLEW